jgi:hypothetical protein
MRLFDATKQQQQQQLGGYGIPPSGTSLPLPIGGALSRSSNMRQALPSSNNHLPSYSAPLTGAGGGSRANISTNNSIRTAKPLDPFDSLNINVSKK